MRSGIGGRDEANHTGSGRRATRGNKVDQKTPEMMHGDIPIQPGKDRIAGMYFVVRSA